MRAFFLLLVLVSILVNYEVLGKVQLLLVNVSETEESAENVEAQCINDDYNDAIAWVTPLQSNYPTAITGI